MCSKLKRYFKKLLKQKEQDKKELEQQRQQNQTIIQDLDGKMISSIDLVNTLSNGIIQTVNSMKYHWRTVQEKCNFTFKYYYSYKSKT